ncbi:MAG: class I SAM-dependent methyltransferase [Vicingaceae bacterium]
MSALLSLLLKLKRFLIFYYGATSINRIHSPFVYEFLQDTVKNRTPFYAFNPLSEYRKLISLNEHDLEVLDLGAGSLSQAGDKRKVSRILRTSVKSQKYAELLFRIVQKVNPENIIELGTSLGLTSIYLAKACPRAQVITVEGSPAIANFAISGFKRFRCENVRQIIGNFDEVLPDLLKEINVVDFAFIDGNHREEASVEYANKIIDKCRQNSVLVMDDIHWSDGMERAWQRIKSNPKVSLSIDLFELGILFFAKRHQKEHFNILY